MIETFTTNGYQMTEFFYGLHLESFALGMASSLAIVLSVFAIQYEIGMRKKCKALQKTLASLKK